MTTVSIYDDIDPAIKKETGQVSLYDELDIPSNTNTEPKLHHNTSPMTNTISTTTTIINNATNIVKPPIPTPSSQVNIAPTIINSYPPPDDNVDPSLTGVPLQHLSTFKSNVLYVGGLSWWVTDADIRRTFDQFGTILEVKIHADKVNGKSKGYGYVEFDQREMEAAVIAKQKLHGHILNDCRISVAFASPERVKGAEYTNTPVHIPRQKLHHNPTLGALTSTSNHPGISQSSIFPKIGSFAGPATVIPTSGVLPSAVAAAAITARNNVMAAANNTGNVLGNALNNTTNTNTSNNNTNTANNNNSSNNGMNILSKFTDRAQLLALLNKTSNRGQNRSTSRSDGSGSRSRSRSRSRSKHRRRRHGASRKKATRRHTSDDRNRDREREKERRRHKHHDRNENGKDIDREREKERRRHRHRSRSDSRYRHKDRSHRRRRDKSDNSESDNNNHTETIPVTSTSNAIDNQHQQD